jgi:CRP/FNR family transcriptional regulator, anaerobic regulatory protein
VSAHKKNNSHVLVISTPSMPDASSTYLSSLVEPSSHSNSPSNVVHCAICRLRSFCLPGHAIEAEALHVNRLIHFRKRVSRGQLLFHANAPLSSLYAVRSGFFKTTLVSREGEDQITGFLMLGDTLGLDAIGTDRHTLNAQAVEDSEICVMPFESFKTTLLHVPEFQKQFYRLMGQEINRVQHRSMLLARGRAEERIADFLLDLSFRYQARGYSGLEFHLKVTREEIGNYLGLTLETVSRIFSRFQKQGIIRIQNKHIVVLQLQHLEHILLGGEDV